MYQRRPKSPAARRIAQRTRTPDHPPWNDSVRTRESGFRGPVPVSGGRVRGAPERLSVTQETPNPSQYYTLITTPAAVLSAAPSPLVGEPQVELMSQLQDVVVRLSQSAVGEKQRLSHMQQRIDAYAALVREQDRMIDELRGMNIKLQKEMDILISFRQQNLNHDLHLMNALEGGAGVDEEIRRAFAWHEERAVSYGKSHINSSSTPLKPMTPRTRDFVRSLVAQLRDERRKRLEVEEQSSRMIGEQQLTIQRLEDRLRPQNSRSSAALFSRHEVLSSPAHTDTSGKRGVVREDGDDAPTTDAVVITPVGKLSQSATAATGSGSVWKESESKQEIQEAKSFMSVRTTETGNGVPLANTVPTNTFFHTTNGTNSKDMSSAAGVEPTSHSVPVELPLAIHGNTYEDAAAILYDIRRRHGF